MFLHSAHLSLFLVIALLAPGVVLAAPHAQPAARPDVADGTILFIENAGQWPAEARFQVWGSPLDAGTTWLTEDAIWISWVDGGDPSPDRFERGVPPIVDVPVSEKARGVNLKLSFVGANPHPRLETVDPVDTEVSYFLGNDPAQWRPAVPVWHGVRYADLYPGVDLEITSAGGRMTQRLRARIGADLAAVAVQVTGAAVSGVEGRALHLATAFGDVALPLPAAEFPLPVVGETVAGLTSTWAIPPDSGQVTGTAVPAARTQAPGDDPGDLIYSTFLGGNSDDLGYSIAVDTAGSAYVTGQTLSYDFPITPGAFDPSLNDSWDTFVAKLNAAGNGLSYATFLGGSGEDDGYAITVDAAGSAYATGLTYSYDFPTTPGAFDTSHNGGRDVFVARLNPSGSGLTYATFLGGSGDDVGTGIGVDETSSTYVAGWTVSGNFPTTPGAFDPSFNGGDWDAFVVKLNSTGSALAYATFLGGSDTDYAGSVLVDEAGSGYVTGMTESSGFPTTPGAFDTSHNGGSDVFVVKLNPVGSGLAYATFLGSTNDDWGSEVRMDVAGNAYVTGYTYSSGFPATPGAFDPSYNGDRDAFVVKLNPTGSGLVYATFVGGSAYDAGWAISIDGAGNVFMTGETLSDNLPTTPGAFDPSYNGWDGFVVKLNPAGTGLDYGTYLGGSGHDRGWSVAVDGKSTVYVTGLTDSSDFPTTPGAYDPTFNGGDYGDVFLTRLDVSGGPTAVTIGSVSAGPIGDTVVPGWLLPCVLGLAGVIVLVARLLKTSRP